MFIDKKIYNPARNASHSDVGGQKGVSLIITFFIMIIILAVVLSISVLLYSEVKVIRNMGDSIGAYYSAESGVEKVLYYDRQFLPVILPDKKQVTRGLCAMFNDNYEGYCAGDPNLDPSHDNLAEHSEYCNSPVYKDLSANGCNPLVCDDCTISFDTAFDGRSYKTTATIKAGYFSIDSGGNVGDASRKIQIKMEPPPME